MKTTSILKATIIAALYMQSGLAMAQEKPPALFLDMNGKELATRQIAEKGSTISIQYDICQINGKVEFKESERNSKIHDDFVAVIKKVAASDPTNDGGCVRTLDKTQYVTKYKRSNLVVRGLSKDEKVIGEKTLIVGPEENLYLSLDLPVSNRKTLKYDDKAHQLLPKDKSPVLYLGLNITPGDILTAPDDSNKWQDKFSVKFMIEASSHPFNSYGVGLGYRLGKTSLLDLEGLSVFAGYFRAKSDLVDNGVIKTDQGRKNSVRIGLSYDLSSALNWVKL